MLHVAKDIRDRKYNLFSKNNLHFKRSRNFVLSLIEINEYIIFPLTKIHQYTEYIYAFLRILGKIMLMIEVVYKFNWKLTHKDVLKHRILFRKSENMNLKIYFRNFLNSNSLLFICKLFYNKQSPKRKLAGFNKQLLQLQNCIGCRITKRCK